MMWILISISACSVGSPNDTVSGERIYNQLCANCHAEDLSGGLGPALGPRSNSSDLPDEFLEISIMSGRGRMPSFSSSLEDSQLQELIGYIRDVQQR